MSAFVLFTFLGGSANAEPPGYAGDVVTGTCYRDGYPPAPFSAFWQQGGGDGGWYDCLSPSHGFCFRIEIGADGIANTFTLDPQTTALLDVSSGTAGRTAIVAADLRFIFDSDTISPLRSPQRCARWLALGIAAGLIFRTTWELFRIWQQTVSPVRDLIRQVNSH
jgi:hypothetical protein